MRSASRESYGVAKAALAAYADGADAAAVAATADEVLAFARLLAREPRLRRSLSDVSRTGEERAALLRGLLAGKMGEDAQGLLATVAGSRWSSPAELLDAVERLGVDVLLSSAERSGDLAEVEDELFRFGQLVSGDPALAATIGDASTEVDRRTALVRDLLAGKAKPATIRLAEQAVHGFGGRAFGAGLTRLVELAAERRESQIAYVTVAEPLEESAETRLAASLAGIYGRHVSLKIVVDPAILGGLSVRVGSDLYDGTIARRLATVRTSLAAK